jgi:DsbC/DsbD-like thiol-disulfide interchange protein
MLQRGLKKRVGSALVFISLWIGVGVVLGISNQIPKEPIKWSIKATLPDHPLKPGEQFFLELTARIEEGWHLYSLEQGEGGPTPTRILMPTDQPFGQSGAIDSAEPKTAMDPNFNLLTQYYEGQAIFTVPVKVAVNAPAGKSEVRVNVSFQTCSDELCLPPKTVKLGVEVNIAR